jgi:hypothetical protein
MPIDRRALLVATAGIAGACAANLAPNWGDRSVTYRWTDAGYRIA